MNNNKNNPEEKPLRRVEDLFNRNYLEKSIYVFLTGLALLMVYFFMQNLDVMKERWQGLVSLLTPFIWGICIAYILMPLFNWLQANLRRLQFMRRHNRICLAISLLITLLLFFSLVGVFFSLVIPEVVNSIVSLFNTLTKSSSYDWLLEYLQTGLQQLKDLGVLNYIEDMSAINGSDGSSLLHYLENPQEYFNKLLSYTTGFLLKAGISAKNIMLAFIVSVYMMIGKETFLAQSRKIIYACTTQDRADHFIDFCRRTNRIFSGFLSGKILDSLIIGIICFIGMKILHLEYAVLISMIIGVTNVIPFFGPFIGAIPSILLLLIVSPQKALIFAIFVLVLQQFDGNILGPKILGDATGLTAFWVIFAVIVMGGMLGIVGMFIGVPIFATIYMIVKNTVETKLKRKKLPIDTNNYR
ncbi:MAG: AI-2E family transporter [Peptococcaceae bacterium]|jgi:predicted PurR-regulated permease PerM|nr:AI-2E family transporter [Peptococcaceae bacterium]